MTPSEITETLSLIVYVGSFATLVYAVYVAISIYKINKGIYDDHREYKRALFADAMRSYHADGASEIDWLDVDFIKRKLPLIFDYYLVGFNDRTIEDEAEVTVREENKYKTMPTNLGFEDRLVSDI